MASECSTASDSSTASGIIRSEETNLSRQWFLISHTSPSVATIGCTRGTASQPIAEGTLGRRLPCRTRSTRARRCRTICLLSGATSRRAGSGCANQRSPDSLLPQVLDPTRRISMCRSQLPFSHGRSTYYLSLPNQEHSYPCTENYIGSADVLADFCNVTAFLPRVAQVGVRHNPKVQVRRERRTVRLWFSLSRRRGRV